YWAYGVTVSGNYAVVADSSSGLKIFNISNPADPRKVGEYDTPGSAYDVAVSGKFAYIADEAAGLQIAEMEPTLTPLYSTGLAAGPDLIYTVSWMETEIPQTQKVRCGVNGGTCTVGTIDNTANTATVTWTPPSEPGDHEIRFFVGTYHYSISRYDRVSFQ
ncbi:MAG: hypothetical protein OEZ59_05395, partial [Deltaproteobacteria bacterium]|nr:hypothetical protein [Deltaproteobacteria bacterium]